jgi:signal transduction histidine kinase
MDPTRAPCEPPPSDRWRRFGRRGLRVAVAAVVIATCLWSVTSQAFGTTLVYSFSISTMSWLFIDLARMAVAAQGPRWIGGGRPGEGQWPGWTWMLLIVVVGAVLGYAAGNEIANRITGLNLPGPFNANLQQTLALLVTALVPAATITYFFQSREVIAKQRADVERAERQAAEQQLKLLESQLEPHMLFNTLANLRVLIAVDPVRAQAMLDRLIAFLRATLAGSRTEAQTLAREFDRLGDYLALMEIRMGPRLATSFTLPPELAEALVPPLLLQPIVENSIQHGLEPKREGGRIDIAATREGDVLVLRIRDTGVGLSAELAKAGGGFGLDHVRERLATLYGARSSFELGDAADGRGGTVATVRLPLSPDATTQAGPAGGSAARGPGAAPRIAP